MNKWISVEERLPEDGQRVLTYSLTEYYPRNLHTFWSAGSYHPDAWWLGEQNHLVEEGNITHWMPLPKEPNNG